MPTCSENISRRERRRKKRKEKEKRFQAKKKKKTITTQTTMAGGWASLGLLEELVTVVEEDFSWFLPTAIQEECIPLLLGGSDVMASAETGSGMS